MSDVPSWEGAKVVVGELGITLRQKGPHETCQKLPSDVRDKAFTKQAAREMDLNEHDFSIVISVDLQSHSLHVQFLTDLTTALTTALTNIGVLDQGNLENESFSIAEVGQTSAAKLNIQRDSEVTDAQNLGLHRLPTKTDSPKTIFLPFQALVLPGRVHRLPAPLLA